MKFITKLRAIYIFGWILLTFSYVQAQTYEIDDVSNVNTCSGTFYDSGGSTGNYQNNESHTATFTSDNGGTLIFNFTSWDVENQTSCSFDGLRIYDGTSSSATLLGTYCTTSPGTIASTGTSLHFEFYSDGIISESGWAASISCGISPVDPCDPIASGNLDSDGDNVSDICDLDDDNDGILDTDEGVSCGSNMWMAGWWQDGPPKSGAEYSYSSAMLSSITDLLNGPGPGVSVEKKVWTSGNPDAQGATFYDVSNVNQTTMTDAISDGDYLESDITTMVDFEKITVFTINTDSQHSLTGSYHVGLTIVDPVTNIETVILEDGFVPSGHGTPTITLNVPNPYLMTGGTTYKFRIYVYNNSGPVRLDNPSISGQICTPIDTDNDGTPDYLDLDSDNDGCPDAVETGHTDPDEDGVLGTSPVSVDSDGLVTGQGGYTGNTSTTVTATGITIDTPPADQVLAVGVTATITVVASAASTTEYTGTAPNTLPDYTVPPATDVSGTLTYQWQADCGSGFVDVANGGNVSGATSATLTITSLTAVQRDCIYNVIVSHPDQLCSEETGAVALPVELASFTATTTLTGVQLDWRTESEIENLGFVLERKTADSDFVELVSYKNNDDLLGQGTTSNANDYSYTDNLVEVGTTYEYRLGDVDYNGVVTYHSTRAVTADQTPLAADVKKFTVMPAYPNPFNPSTTIRYGIETNSNVNIQIYDITGKLINTLINQEQTQGWHSIIWNGTNQHGKQVPAGIYLSRVISGTNIKTNKLMLLK